jgi:hypothetical protein
MSVSTHLVVCIDGLLSQQDHAIMLESFLTPIIVNLVKTHSSCDLQLVVFKARPPFAEFVVNSSKTTKEAQEVLNWIKTGVDGVGGGLDRRAAVCAGLCASLQLLQQRTPDRRHILLCTSHDPVIESCSGLCVVGGHYLNHAHRVAQLSNTCLSIIAPLRSQELEEMFHASLSSNAPTFSDNPYRERFPSFFVRLHAPLSVAAIAMPTTITPATTAAVPNVASASDVWRGELSVPGIDGLRCSVVMHSNEPLVVPQLRKRLAERKCITSVETCTMTAFKTELAGQTTHAMLVAPATRDAVEPLARVVKALEIGNVALRVDVLNATLVVVKGHQLYLTLKSTSLNS